MEPLDLEGLPEDALLLVDSAPIIYMLEGHPAFMPRFKPLFDAHAAGRLRFAVTTLAIAEVLTGPLRGGDEALARRYRAILDSWGPVALDSAIAEERRATAGLAQAETGRRGPSCERARRRCRCPGDARP